MAKRPGLKSAVRKPEARAQEAAAAAAKLIPSSAAPKAELVEDAPSRTVSYHLPEDLAALVEDLADARFRLLRAQRDAERRAGRGWTGGRVRRSASQVAAEALAAHREAMERELREIEGALKR